RRAAWRWSSGAVGWHGLDGYVHAQHVADRAGAGPRKSSLRGGGQQILPALSVRGQRDEQRRRQGLFAVGRNRRILLRHSPRARRRPHLSQFSLLWFLARS